MTALRRAGLAFLLLAMPRTVAAATPAFTSVDAIQGSGVTAGPMTCLVYQGGACLRWANSCVPCEFDISFTAVNAVDGTVRHCLYNGTVTQTLDSASGEGILSGCPVFASVSLRRDETLMTWTGDLTIDGQCRHIGPNQLTVTPTGWGTYDTFTFAGTLTLYAC